jgi:Ca-activated chloride channel family protein
MNPLDLFLYPWVLMLLAIPALLLVWVWGGWRQTLHHPVVLPLDHGRTGTGRFWWITLSLAESLPPLILGIGIMILAGPKKYGTPETKRAMTNIEFCVDISGSMTAPFGDGTRYDAAMNETCRFLDYRKGDAFGLTFFGNNFIHWCPLTTDPSAIRHSLPFMRPEVAPPWFGGTMIAKALQGCKKHLLEREEGDRMILLITDGESFDLNSVAQELTEELKKNNITVFSIIIGESQIQDEVLTICRGTGGDAFLANDAASMGTIFQKIDQMKQAKMEKTIAEPMDYFTPYAWTGLGLALLATLIALCGWRYTPW